MDGNGKTGSLAMIDHLPWLITVRWISGNGYGQIGPACLTKLIQ